MQVDNPFSAPRPWPCRFDHTEAAAHGRSVARWMRFLGILHYVGAAFFTLGSLAWFGALEGQLEDALIMFVALFVVVTYLAVQAHWLCRGGVRIRAGVDAADVAEIVSGLHDVGLHFTLLAVPQVLFVVLSLLVLVL